MLKALHHRLMISCVDGIIRHPLTPLVQGALALERERQLAGYAREVARKGGPRGGNPAMGFRLPSYGSGLNGS